MKAVKEAKPDLEALVNVYFDNPVRDAAAAGLHQARIGAFSGTGLTGKAIPRNARVRGPPAFLA